MFQYVCSAVLGEQYTTNAAHARQATSRRCLRAAWLPPLPFLHPSEPPHPSPWLSAGPLATSPFPSTGKHATVKMSTGISTLPLETLPFSCFSPPCQVVTVACGGIANAALTESGRVFTWGSSDDGGLGRPGGPDAPEQFPGEVRACLRAWVGGWESFVR